MPALIRLLILSVTLIALALPAGASARERTFDYVANRANLSEPRYSHNIERQVIKLPAFDGKLLYIEVTKPKPEGQYPVILEASPYHGTLADREGTRILPDPLGADGKPQGLTGYFAPRGYAVVMMDLRGTGRSQGCLDHLGPKDARDLEQVVEWAARQPWSNGRVGMTGHSYVGSTPSVAAAQNPRGLATIVPSAGLASMYHHQFQGGVPYMLQWAGVQWSYEYLAVARKLPPVGPADPVTGSPRGDDFGNDMEETGCGAPNSSLVAGEDQLSGRYSDWHVDRDWGEEAKDADIPVFAVHGINDNAARVPALDWFLARRNAKDKLWLGQWDHGSGCCPTRRGLQWTSALHAWFDKHLAKRDVPTGPDIELFLADDQSFSAVRTGARTEVLTAKDLPVADDALWLFPNADGTLRNNPKPKGQRTFVGTKQGFSELIQGDPTWKTGLSFRGPRVERDVVMAGLPKLVLHASVTAPRVHLIANLLDEDEKGKRRRISQFAINPELRDGLANRKTVVPGQRYELRPTPMAMAHRLRRGHRLVLQVTTSDPDKVPLFAEDPRVTVFTGVGGTRVKIPTVSDPVTLRDDVKLQFADKFTSPPHETVEHEYTTGAPDGGLRTGATGSSEFIEFELLEGQDNAQAKAVAVPSQPADLDLFLQKRAADGSWEEIEVPANGGETDRAEIMLGRLYPGVYRLEVNNFAGPPANDVRASVQFFASEESAG